jgi:hypothetical protein
VLIGLLLFGSTVYAAERGGLSDPLRPLGYHPPAVSASQAAAVAKPINWHLSAVLHSAARSVAVINGRPLQLDDEIDGYRLVKIEPASVLLQKKQEKIVLRRSGTGLKKAFPLRDVEKGNQP